MEGETCLAVFRLSYREVDCGGYCISLCGRAYIGGYYIIIHTCNGSRVRGKTVLGSGDLEYQVVIGCIGTGKVYGCYRSIYVRCIINGCTAVSIIGSLCVDRCSCAGLRGRCSLNAVVSGSDIDNLNLVTAHALVESKAYLGTQMLEIEFYILLVSVDCLSSGIDELLQ